MGPDALFSGCPSVCACVRASMLRTRHSPAGLPSTTSSGGWLGSRVVSVLDSGAEGPGFKSQSLQWVRQSVASIPFCPFPLSCPTKSGNSLRQTVHTHCASLHQAAKLVAALLRVAGVTAGLAESNGSLPSGL